MAWPRGAVVFVEHIGGRNLTRQLITLRSGAPVVHAAIATGRDQWVIDAGRTHGEDGIRLKIMNSPEDSYHAFVNRSDCADDVAELILCVAEGYLSEKQRAHPGTYGAYSVRGVLRHMFQRKTGMGQQQWGNDSLSPHMYCSQFVARVLLAAQQTGGSVGANVVSAPLAARCLPLDLMNQLSRDPYWQAV